ncbi:MAG: malto-oligosyltrehalose trehalohydrolase [Actinomycetota bacterium]|jgi:maltooligosyltrehalose trehalohydrolase|nr:malto-oligosyltrehalose trehalohydrolase [Actinomycetota bacterium]
MPASQVDDLCELVTGMPCLGAVPVGDGTTRFSLWAPAARSVQLHLIGDGHPTGQAHPGDPAGGEAHGGDPTGQAPATRAVAGLGRDRYVDVPDVGGGYRAVVVDDCGPGQRYRFVLDGHEHADPASRFQPDGVFGPSAVVEVARPWGDGAYRPRPLAELVICEVHVGTATPGGTFASAMHLLDGWAELGITAVELMPVAQFSGTRNWGYDGVFPFAVQHSYGGPDGLAHFVDACHRRDLAVVLDVVYNHLGPEGNVLGAYGPYFTDRYRTPWGAAVNVDGPHSDEVRAFWLQNAVQWFAWFHVDALRLDAIHGIVDPTAAPFVEELSRAAAVLGARLQRPCALVAESADNNPRVVTARDAGGIGMDAQWNDDFHHALHAVVTGERRGYYADFGRIEDVARAMDQGFVYQGTHSVYRGRRHGAPSGGLDPERFVVFAQNHDQIGNRPRGDRLASLVTYDRLRLVAAAVLLAPGVPLLFMGEEYGETAPFPYFVDHRDPRLLDAVRRGRLAEMGPLPSGDEPPDPGDVSTFRSAVLVPGRHEDEPNRKLRALHRRLIGLRRSEPALACTRRDQARADAHGSVVTLTRRVADSAVIVWLNFADEAVEVALPVPPRAVRSVPYEPAWRVLLDSADPTIGGSGPPVPAGGSPGTAVTLAPWSFSAFRVRVPDWRGARAADGPDRCGRARGEGA